MSQGLVERQNLEDIADAIRSKNGSSDTYTPAEMAQAISGIHTADEVVLVQKTVNANGQYNASDDSADGYSGVRVNVPNSYSASDEGKVVSNGDLVAQTSKNINTNGTHDTTSNNSVVVDVPNSYAAADEGKVVSGGALVGQTSRNISENGTYDTTLNSEVVVNTHADPVLYKIYDPDYYMDTTGLICTLSGREYYKTYADPAFVAYAYCESYTRPIIISKTEEGATFTTMSRNFSPSQTTIDGETWYVGSHDYAMGGNLVSTNGFAKKINGTYETFQLAIRALYDIVVSDYGKIKQNGNYPIPTGYDGYDAFSVNVVPNVITKVIAQNGTYYASDDNADGYSSVTVNVSGGSDEIVIPDLPTGYTKIESVYFPGDNGYIKIPSVPANSKIKVKFQPKDDGEYPILASKQGSTATTSYDFELLYRTTSGIIPYLWCRDKNASMITYDDIDVSIRLDIINPQPSVQNSKYLLIFYTKINIGVDYPSDSGQYVYIGYYQGGKDYKGNVYYCIVTNPTETENLYFFVPCYRNSDNVIGFYDVVNDVFYENEGNGTFQIGTYL